MKSNYKPIGEHIRLVDERNIGLKVTTLLGLSITKEFIPSVANTIGSNMENYKIIRKNQFACSLMQVRRDKKIPVALLRDFEEAIISQAYPVFEVIDEYVLLPEYLMMWFSRLEFDRESCFYAVGGVRGSLEWEDFCNMQLPVPSLENQKEIVAEYNTIANRIKLNKQINQKLEETAQAIYKQWFVEFEFPDENGKPYRSSGGEMEFCDRLEGEVPVGWSVKDTEKVIRVKDGTHDSPKPASSGYPLVTSTHLEPYSVNTDNAYLISKNDFTFVNRRSKVDTNDILFSMIGTVGTISFVLKENVDFAITNVGLFKTSESIAHALYLLFHLKSPVIKNYIQTCLLGSTQNYMTLTELRSIPFLVPDEQVLEKYNNVMKLIIDNIRNKTLIIYGLKQLQNTLLDKVAKSNGNL